VKISFTVSGAPTIALKLQDALALRSVYDLK
jgi:hypothetical protein